MKIFDLRNRPPYKEFADMSKTLEWTNLRLGAHALSPSYRDSDIEKYWEEFDAAGITKALILGRNDRTFGVKNETISEFAKQNSGKFIGFAGIDVSNTRHNAIDEIDRCVEQLGLKGIAIDPGRVAERMYHNDRRLYPIYEHCQQRNLPVVLMSGPFAGPSIDYTNPWTFDEIAADFPRLRFLAAHGCWPYVMEMIGVGFKRENMFICPDIYMSLAGRELYIDAANSFLQDQFCFATAYPFRPQEQTTKEFLEMPFRDDLKEKILWKNAHRFIGIEEA